MSFIDTNNSTTTLLTSATSLIYTGQWSNSLQYVSSTIMVYSDVAGTLELQFSSDGVNIDIKKYYAINIADDTNGGSVHTITHISKYFRVKFTANSDQSEFRLQTIHNCTDNKMSISNLSHELIDSEDILNVRAINTGKQPDGDYVNVPADGVVFENTTILGGTYLTSALNDSSTTITVNSTADFTSTGSILLNKEQIIYTGKTSTTFTGCTRGSYGTTALSHIVNSDCGQLYISDWVDTDGWNSIEFYIKTDVISQPKGIIIESTNNVQANPPEIKDIQYYACMESDLRDNRKLIRLAPILDGVRIKYGNGNTTQSNFFISMTLKTNTTVNKFNNGLALLVSDFQTEVALGNIPNYAFDYKFGRNNNISPLSIPEDIWNNGGIYSGQPTFFTPATVNIVSNNVADTSAGVGARTVRIYGLKSNTSEYYESEDITLNGTTNVTSINTWWRVNRAIILTAGSSAANVGTITITSTGTGTPIFATIESGINQTLIAAYTVPYNKKLLMKTIFLSITRASGASGSALITLRVRENENRVFRTVDSYDIQTSGDLNLNISGGFIFDSGTDIRFRVDDVSDLNTIANARWIAILY